MHAQRPLLLVAKLLEFLPQTKKKVANYLDERMDLFTAYIYGLNQG